jgi:hypothetical protein
MVHDDPILSVESFIICASKSIVHLRIGFEWRRSSIIIVVE